jgi:alginate O-acetyltransferase complex protein AlgI
MLFGGLWHGANWTFIVWGAYHGTLLIGERWAGRKPAYQRMPRPFRIGMTFVLVLGSWVWFRAESLPSALMYFAAMSGGGSTSETTALLAAQLFAPDKVALMAIAAIFLCAPFQAHDWSEDVTYRKAILVPFAFASAILVMFSQSANPFLYFQF